MPFDEIADGVWVARYDWFDVNVTLIRGDRGLLMVDTHASAAAAREVIDDVRSLGAGPVVAVVNTHEHFDHWFGNAAVLAAFTEHGPVPVHAHETAVERMPETGARARAAFADAPDEPHRDDVLATELVPADRPFSSATVIDLGDRAVELIHPGRGHTAGDLVVRVPDADVLLAGDLIEESAARDATPGFGPDCYPLDWPLTLDLVLGLTSERTVVVPGHGAVVDQDFVLTQRSAVGVLAETIRDLAGRGVPASSALDAVEEWPFDRRYLADAVRRGYEQLPRSQKRLPLI